MRHAQSFTQHLVRRTSARVSRAIFCLAILLLGFGTAVTFQSGQPGQKISPYSIEFENLRASSKAVCQPYEKLNSLERQDMSGFGQGWSGNAQLFWRCQLEHPTPMNPMQGMTNIGEKAKNHNPPHLIVPFNVPKAGTYEIVLHYTTAPDYWAFYVSLDGQPVGDRVEGYSQTVAPKARNLGQYKLTGGGHEFEVRVHDNQASNLEKYYVGLDRLELREPALIKKPSPQTTMRKPG